MGQKTFEHALVEHVGRGQQTAQHALQAGCIRAGALQVWDPASGCSRLRQHVSQGDCCSSRVYVEFLSLRGAHKGALALAGVGLTGQHIYSVSECARHAGSSAD